MLLNYLTIAWRHLLRNRTFSLINISGLSVGITCALLIIFHVKDELSYDKGFSKSDRIFRVTLQELDNDSRHWAATSPLLGPTMKSYFPEIEQVVRFHRPYPYQLLSYTPSGGTEKRFEEKNGFFADAGVTRMFDLQFVQGNPATALAATDAIVLTEAMAKKYFGTKNPLGKIIQDDVRKLPLTVTGVVKKFPFATHLQFDYLLSMATITKYQDQRQLETRTWAGFYTYVLLKQPTAAQAMAARMPAFMVRFYEPVGESRQEILTTRRLPLQPIGDIHLHSKLEKEMNVNSDITYVYIFSVVALFILLIAAVNFVNISTALAFNRMKEIGLRKVIGAGRGQLIRQFLGESLLVTLLATVLAFVLLGMAIPFYNDMAVKEFRIEHILTMPNLLLVLILVLTLGLLAGLYPAWFVSKFNPVNSLKGKKDVRGTVPLVRKVLIVFQFVVSVFMIFSTIVIYRQLNLFHQKDLGFDKEQLIAVTMYGPMWEKFGAMMQDIDRNPAITSRSIVSTLPGERFSVESFSPMGATGDVLPDCRTMCSDENMLRTLNIPLQAGRHFVNQFPSIKNHEFILNETAVKSLRLKNPIGTKLVAHGDTGEVVAVVNDFNFASLHASVEPLVLQYNPFNSNYLLLKVQPGQVPATLDFMEKEIKKLVPGSVFNYTFIDERLNRLYASENRMSRVFKAFAAFAIFISCLGLFGLSAYSAQLRVKEVGIRKVLGASVGNVTVLLSKDFMVLVLIATVVSWPLAWYVMHQWLNGFAYRIHIGIWTFVWSGCCAMLLALCTVGYQAIRTAMLNPVDNLRTQS